MAVTVTTAFSSAAIADDNFELQYAELKAYAKRRGIDVQKQGEGIFKIVLPSDIPRIPGFSYRIEGGKRVVYPGQSPEYGACLQGLFGPTVLGVGSATAGGAIAGATLGADAIKDFAKAGAGGFVTAATGASALDGFAGLNCVNSARERLMNAVYQLPGKAPGKGVVVVAGGATKTLTGNKGEAAQINAMLAETEKRLAERFRKEIKDEIDKKFGDAGDKQKKMQSIVASEMKKMKEKTTAYYAAVRKAQDEAQKKADARRIELENAQKLHDDIQLAAQGLTAFVGIAFSDNPKLAAEINRGIAGVSQLAQIGVAISVASGPFGVTMLGLSAMGVMNSMFSDSGEAGYTKIFLDNVMELRKDIRSLRGEMHERFDALQNSLSTLAAFMDKRFNVLDTTIAEIKNELQAIHTEKDIFDRLTASGLSYSLTSTFSLSVQNCLKGNAIPSLAYRDLTVCVGNFVVHADQVSRLDLIAGGGRVPPDYLGATGTKLFLSVDPRQTLGYLTALDAKIREEDPSKVPPSPLQWKLATEAYLTLIDRFDTMSAVKKEISKASFLSKEKADDIRTLIDGGQQIKTAAAMLREEGAITALGRYGVEMKQLVDSMTNALFDELSRSQLNLTKIVELRHDGRAQIDASHFLPCVDLYKRVAGIDPIISAEADRVLFRVGRHCNAYGSVETDSSNDASEKEKAYNRIKDNPESLFSMHDELPEGQARQMVQSRYLERQETGKFTADVKKAIPAALEKVIASKEVIEKLQRVEYLQHLLIQYVLVGLDNPADPVTQKNVKLLQSMVTTPAKVKALFDTVSYESNQPFKARFAAEANSLVQSEEARVRTAIGNNPPNDSFPLIDATLQRLRRLDASIH